MHHSLLRLWRQSTVWIHLPITSHKNPANRNRKNAASSGNNSATERLTVFTGPFSSFGHLVQTKSRYIPLTVVGKEKKEARKEIRRDTKVMLEEAEQDIDGETAEEVDAVGKQEGRI